MKKKFHKLISCILSAAMLLSVVPFAASAADDDVTAASKVTIGEMKSIQSTQGNHRAAAMYGDYLYALQGVNSISGEGDEATTQIVQTLKIYDVSKETPEDVTPTESTDLTAVSSDSNVAILSDGYGIVWVNGDFLYVCFHLNNNANGGDEIRKYSLENPKDPKLVAKFDSASDSKDGKGQMAVFENYLFVSTGRIAAFDTSSATAETVQNMKLRFGCSDTPVVTDNKYIYLIKNQTITDKGSDNTTDEVVAIDLSAVTAINSIWQSDVLQNTITVMNISDNEDADFNNTRTGNKMQLDNGYLYVSVKGTSNSYIYRVDLSDGVKTGLQKQKVYEGSLKDFVADGNTLYVHTGTENHEILTYTMATDGTPTQGESISTKGQSGNGCTRLDITDDYLYFCDNNYVNIFPVTREAVSLGLEKTEPSWIAGTKVGTSNQNIASAVYGNYLYVDYRNGETNGIEVYNIENPANPVKITTTDTRLSVTGDSTTTAYKQQVDCWSPIAVYGDYLYYAVNAEGVRKFSLKNSAQPAYVASYKRTGTGLFSHILVKDGILYAGGRYADLNYWEDNETETHINENTVNGTTYLGLQSVNGMSMQHEHLVGYGDYLYVMNALTPDVLHFVKVKNQVKEEGNTGTTKYNGMEADPKGFLYLITSDGKLVTVDVRNGYENLKNGIYASAVNIDGLETTKSKNMLLSGNYLYIGAMKTATETMYVYDVSVPTAPKLVKTLPNVLMSSMSADGKNNVYVSVMNNSGNSVTPYVFSSATSVDSETTKLNRFPVTFTGEVLGEGLTVTVGEQNVTPTIENGMWSYTATELPEGDCVVTAKIGDLTASKTYTVSEKLVVVADDRVDKADNTVTDTLSITNNRQTDVPLLCVLAVYDTNSNKLLGTGVSPVTAYAETTQTVELKAENVSLPSNYYVRLYVWTAEGLQPVCESMNPTGENSGATPWVPAE